MLSQSSSAGHKLQCGPYWLPPHARRLWSVSPGGGPKQGPTCDWSLLRQGPSQVLFYVEKAFIIIINLF